MTIVMVTTQSIKSIARLFYFLFFTALPQSNQVAAKGEYYSRINTYKRVAEREMAGGQVKGQDLTKKKKGKEDYERRR